MKTLGLTLFLFISCVCFYQAQTTRGVGINTTDLAPGSALQINSTTRALVQPRMTTAQMEAIPTPLDGALVFNTTANNWYIRTEGVWQPFLRTETPSAILNRGSVSGGIVLTNDDTMTSFPVNENHVLSAGAGFYKLSANHGEVQVLKSGTYLISAGLSTTNMPVGNRNYRIEVSINGTNPLIITDGAVNLPNSDYWGTSGNIVLLLTAGDVINVQYILKGATSGTANAAFFNIGVSKL